MKAYIYTGASGIYLLYPVSNGLVVVAHYKTINEQNIKPIGYVFNKRILRREDIQTIKCTDLNDLIANNLEWML